MAVMVDSIRSKDCGSATSTPPGAASDSEVGQAATRSHISFFALRRLTEGTKGALLPALESERP